MNRIILMGRLTADAELSTKGETEYCRFSLAVDRVKKGGAEAITDFFSCIAFGGNAKYITGYAVKGQRLLISGAVHFDSYTGKSGEKRTSTTVVIDTVENADGKQIEKERKKEKTGIEDEDTLPY